MDRTLLRRARGRTAGWLVVATLVGLLVGLVAGPVVAGVIAPGSPTLPTGQAGEPATEHTISVTGTGKVTVVPDQATVRLGVVIERSTATEAREVAAAEMTKVIAAIKALGIAERDITTSLVSLAPVWDYPERGTPRIRGYQLSNIVTVIVRDLDKVGDVLDDSVTSGATSVDGISFQLSDRTAAEAQAREAAVKDARAKADTLARVAGVRITGVAQLSESVSLPPWYGREYSAAPDAGGGTPILSGTTDVVITVSAVYLIG
jgi:uncharacterized protein YggE